MDYKKDIRVEKLDGAEIKITGEIPAEQFMAEKAAALKALGKHVEIDGFRKGKAPEKEIIARVGEGALLNEMAERSLGKIYPEILKAHELETLGYPQIQITKIAADNPLGFTMTVATVPDITLPDYKKIAAKLNTDKASADVTDEEVDTQIKDIMRQRVAYERLQEKAKAGATPETDGTTDLPTPESEAAKETHTHEDGTVHEGPAHPEPEAVKDEELPALTDDYVKGLGQPGQFETVDDFKTKLKEHIGIEKEREVNANHRAKLTDEIIEQSKMELPKVLVDSELQQMTAQMSDDLARAGMSMEDYLKHINKTREDMMAEWKPAAEKRAKLQLILNEIAKKEDVKPDETAAEAQVKALKEQYKDADEARVRVYVYSLLQNEAVMKLLEEQS